jgi:hypothetical protein
MGGEGREVVQLPHERAIRDYLIQSIFGKRDSLKRENVIGRMPSGSFPLRSDSFYGQNVHCSPGLSCKRELRTFFSSRLSKFDCRAFFEVPKMYEEKYLPKTSRGYLDENCKAFVEALKAYEKNNHKEVWIFFLITSRGFLS